MSKSEIITIVRTASEIDVNLEFRFYKYAIPECEPVKLSNGKYLHVYKVTNYENEGMSLHGDPDEEQQAFENEMY